MDKFFTPNDFRYFHNGKLEPVMACDLANAKLERQGISVTGYHYDSIDVAHNFSSIKEFRSSTTHKALLINIEPIETCKHPIEKVTTRIDWQGRYKCECGFIVVPSGFKGIEE